MVKVSIEVCDGAVRFYVAVRAESIRRALDIVRERYPGRNVRVNFPIDPESSFVKDPAARAGIAESRQQKERAA